MSCLSDHPQYLDLFIQVIDFIMNGDGPLGHDVRSYIAILVYNLFISSYDIYFIYRQLVVTNVLIW